MLVSLGAIALIATLLGVGFSRLFPYQFSWFLQLRRPKWLTFEPLIPLIWIGIFICGICSANYAWQSRANWLIMSAYGILELLILAYTPTLCRLRSLTAGTVVAALGLGWGLALTLQVAAIAPMAAWLLLPYLLWSPIGTYVTWSMIKLNPQAR
ncbi:MAG: tryptophan-rich sensory protein [Pseudanabaenaceae cyanobacterium bins.68]|nr:tryptophan-rich sensory protein [Pseudanabaenaceae cyanobacterium bins.68]